MINMDTERFEERLNEANEAFDNSIQHIQMMKDNNLPIPNGLVVSIMAVAHLRSTLRYINGDIDEMLPEVDKNTKIIMEIVKD